MRKLWLILYLIAGVPTESVGQTDWESKFNGYVITDDDRVVKGYLKYDGRAIDRGTRILLYKKPNEEPQIFYSLELKGYAIKKDTFRILHNLQPFLEKDKFYPRVEAKLEQRGKLKLFSIVFEDYTATSGTWVYPGPSGPTGSNPQAPYYSPMPGGVKEITTYIIFNTKNEIVGIKKENFKDVMHELMPDAPLLLNKIDKKVLKFKDLEKIITEYNQMFK